MKKVIFTFLVLALFPLSNIFSQAVYYSEGFETYDTITYPQGWYSKFYGVPDDSTSKWTVRDSGTCVPGIQCTATSKAYLSKKSVAVSWTVYDPANGHIADAWLVTKKFGALPTDAMLTFYACGGSTTYSDSMEVLISPTGDTALSSFQLISQINWPPGSVYGNFQQQFVDLSSYAGTTPRIAFRYYMDCTSMGFVVYIDNVQMLGTVGISQIGNNIPKKFALSQNYPNPFNPVTKIKFDVPKNGNVTVEVFNNLGQVISTLHNGYTNAGYYETNFDGSRLTSGIYFYRMTSNDFTETKKMILVK
jgi:Secretion system C-terminal sorting domain/Cleaved Adhesin Domain